MTQQTKGFIDRQGNKIEILPTQHTHTIDEITDFATHTHTISEIDELQTVLDNKAATEHRHAISQIDDLQLTLNSKAGKEHSHAIADVEELQTELDDKADTVHSHEIDNVNGLQDALSSKADASHTHTIVPPSSTPAEYPGDSSIRKMQLENEESSGNNTHTSVVTLNYLDSLYSGSRVIPIYVGPNQRIDLHTMFDLDNTDPSAVRDIDRSQLTIMLRVTDEIVMNELFYDSAYSSSETGNDIVFYNSFLTNVDHAEDPGSYVMRANTIYLIKVIYFDNNIPVKLDDPHALLFDGIEPDPDPIPRFFITVENILYVGAQQ